MVEGARFGIPVSKFPACSRFRPAREAPSQHAVVEGARFAISVSPFPACSRFRPGWAPPRRKPSGPRCLFGGFPQHTESHVHSQHGHSPPRIVYSVKGECHYRNGSLLSLPRPPPLPSRPITPTSAWNGPLPWNSPPPLLAHTHARTHTHNHTYTVATITTTRRRWLQLNRSRVPCVASQTPPLPPLPLSPRCSHIHIYNAQHRIGLAGLHHGWTSWTNMYKRM